MNEDEFVEMTMDAFDEYLDTLDVRELQKESARAITTMKADNNSIYKFNKVAYHNSHLWYKAVIKHYVMEHGGMPSEVGPGVSVTFVIDN
jgi:hypothetical protein